MDVVLHVTINVGNNTTQFEIITSADNLDYQQLIGRVWKLAVCPPPPHGTEGPEHPENHNTHANPEREWGA